MSETRILTANERAIVDQLWEQKASGRVGVEAYATSTIELTLREWNKIHPVDENTRVYTVPPGTPLRITMLSRFCDFGLTDDLDAERGYKLRLGIEDASITDIRLQKEPTI